LLVLPAEKSAALKMLDGVSKDMKKARRLEPAGENFIKG
jgi:hypothetical protein